MIFNYPEDFVYVLILTILNTLFLFLINSKLVSNSKIANSSKCKALGDTCPTLDECGSTCDGCDCDL